MSPTGADPVRCAFPCLLGLRRVPVQRWVQRWPLHSLGLLGLGPVNIRNIETSFIDQFKCRFG